MPLVGGASTALAAQQLVAQGYGTDSLLQTGMIVRLDSKNPNKVTALDLGHINKMFGVVVSANESSLTIGQAGGSQEAFVTNTGQHEVLVSNQNGPISIGDYVTESNISGIGMKADANEPVVLGQAAGSFDGSSNVLSTVQLKVAGSQKQTVGIGLVPVDINIASNPLDQGAKGVPVFLSKITKYATNKSVSATRVYLGMLCVLAGVIITVTLIYSSIKNSFISIGRNPLAKKAIAMNLIRVLAIALIVFAISLGAAYLIISQ